MFRRCKVLGSPKPSALSIMRSIDHFTSHSRTPVTSFFSFFPSHPLRSRTPLAPLSSPLKTPCNHAFSPFLPAHLLTSPHSSVNPTRLPSYPSYPSYPLTLLPSCPPLLPSGPPALAPRCSLCTPDDGPAPFRGDPAPRDEGDVARAAGTPAPHCWCVAWTHVDEVAG